MPEEAFDVVAEIYVDAAPDVVFSFFVDPDKLARWRGSPAIWTLAPAEASGSPCPTTSLPSDSS